MTWLTAAPSMSRPISSAFSLMVARPAISLTTKLVPLPTDSGSTCSYASLRLAMAETWRPALWANADGADVGRLRVQGPVDQLGDVVADAGQPLQAAFGQRGESQLQR